MDKNKKYEALLKICYQQYSNQKDDIKKCADSIFYKLLSENHNEVEKVARHTKQIYPCIAIYKAIVEVTGDKAGAYNLIVGMYQTQSKRNAKLIRGILKFPGLYKKVPGIMAKMITGIFGEESGFSMNIISNESKECHIDMMVCPYHQNCKKYGCEELTTVFCNSDDIAYGNMHDKVKWLRTKTLGRGDKCCDFIIKINE